ncbi:unnamed protein product [Effrenium voratum]|nr:unnamed protein product [Effrenium voratum]|mmetsp:Transcript_95203/g.226673  ORF Transcript_95203/g.226673 Transcript_95203/m.226673 type:complete len:310 (-) Transcript_95203:85-1014(-)|eukprot:CAMPEP_0181453120 /NCGR_PEP_ID=MMETSP1110-20121109/29562_1 /TAXON_ID=174948 /ORGANISM="Symbiodinium sp., Strain CCMP421" /LENGTH=309 /DNA_ID=CAMNT_0023577431 /DNA_START=93 /DNA_END=1022 /DNA_ORIENTATION=+
MRPLLALLVGALPGASSSSSSLLRSERPVSAEILAQGDTVHHGHARHKSSLQFPHEDADEKRPARVLAEETAILMMPHDDELSRHVEGTPDSHPRHGSQRKMASLLMPHWDTDDMELQHETLAARKHAAKRDAAFALMPHSDEADLVAPRAKPALAASLLAQPKQAKVQESAHGPSVPALDGKRGAAKVDAKANIPEEDSLEDTSPVESGPEDKDFDQDAMKTLEDMDIQDDQANLAEGVEEEDEEDQDAGEEHVGERDRGTACSDQGFTGNELVKDCAAAKDAGLCDDDAAARYCRSTCNQCGDNPEQ